MIELNKFWNLNRDFYGSENDQDGYYRNYSDFLQNSKSDPVLKNFNFSKKLDEIPSYGSSVNLVFSNTPYTMGARNTFLSQTRLNNLLINVNINYTNIEPKRSNKILDFLGENSGKPFIFQIQSKDGLSDQEAYKSLYSIKPYLVQEFQSQGAGNTYNYIDDQSISFLMTNNDFSYFNYRNLIFAQCLPERTKDLINEYWGKEELDINPSYPLEEERVQSVDINSLGNSRPVTLPLDDSNNKIEKIFRVRYNNLNDDDTLRIISFFLSKKGVETTYIRTSENEFTNVTLKAMTHTFVFKNSNNISIDFQSKFLRLKDGW